MGDVIQSVSERLAESERIIERGLQSFIEVGAALLKIRDERLYREEYGTFEEYCIKRWKWRRNYANKQIQAAEVVRNLGTIVPTPQNEAQARPLTALSPDQQPVAWAAAVEQSETGKPTAREVEAVVRTMLPPPLPDLKPVPTPAEIEAERRAREAERKLAEVMDERRAENMRRYSMFRRLIESTEFVANFFLPSAEETWNGITDAGGEAFLETLRGAVSCLTRIEAGYPYKPKRPAIVAPRAKDGSA